MIGMLFVTFVSRSLERGNKKIHLPNVIYWILTILILTGSVLVFCDLNGEVISYLNQNLGSNFSPATVIALARVMFVIAILCIQFLAYFLNEVTKNPLLAAVIESVSLSGLFLFIFTWLLIVTDIEVSLVFLPIIIGFLWIPSSLIVARLMKNDSNITNKETSKKVKTFCMVGIAIGALVMIGSAFIIGLIVIL